MVLRFRDLVAETIKEHQAIAQKAGYVWWGWWNKPDERIPRPTFLGFRQTIARQSFLPIYLIDSGHDLLYNAKLLEITMSDTETLVECPEKERSPTYYSATKYKVWFKLSDIHEGSENDIRRWSYDEVGDFIDDPYGSRFQNK